ncbi:MAG: hypothetical protein U0892_19755 [Pirellulales bacterium]
MTYAQDKKISNVPAAPLASPEVVDSLIANGAYQYAVSIRPTTDDDSLKIGDPTSESPRYSAVAAKGIESYVGVPMKTDGEYDTERPSRLYCKIKVVSITNDVVQVKLTVGHTSDVEKTNGAATWNEQVWTVDREVRLNETDTVQLTAPKGKSVPSFDVRYRVRKFEGKPQ